VACNITIVERLDWAKIRAKEQASGGGAGAEEKSANPAQGLSIPPMRGEARWAEYAPHDDGVLRNVLSFLLASRFADAQVVVALADGCSDVV